MHFRHIALLASLTLLIGCAGASQQPTEPQVPSGVGNAAQHPPLSGPARCSNAITEYEKIVDRDVTTGYLSQTVYDEIVAGINSGARPSCAAGRDTEAVGMLARVKTSHGYR